MEELKKEETLRFRSIVGAARKVMAVVHQHPDGDAAGCSLALVAYLRSIGKDAKAIFPDPLDNSTSFVLSWVPSDWYISLPEGIEDARKEIADSDVVIIMDCNGFPRTGDLAGSVEASKAEKILIDHHLCPAKDKFSLTFSQTEISSASEMTYWLLLDMPEIGGDPRKLPQPAATLLLTGMTTDTNNFGNSTFPSTFKMASGLLDAGVDRDDVLDKLYHQCRENRLRALGFMLCNNMRITPEGAAIMILRKDKIKEFDLVEGDTENFVNFPLTLAKVRLSLWLKEDEGYFRVSLRSRKGVSAADMAARFFNGGGHILASGGRLWIGQPEDKTKKWVPSADDVEAYVDNAIKEFFR
jgi:phosphoesterase RecJ-like protein